MPFLPLAVLSLAWSFQTEAQPAYLRDFSKPAPLLPQTQPFIQYTRPAYDFNISSAEAKALGVEGKRPKQWWSGELNGMQVGGPTLVAEAPFGRGGNLLRAAYGMRLWGTQVGDKGWVDKADRMARLFLSQADGKTPISFNFRDKTAKFGGMTEGGFVSAVWLKRWLDEFPSVDFAEKAQGFIKRAQSEAEMASPSAPDAAWLVATLYPNSGPINSQEAISARAKIKASLAAIDPTTPEGLRLAGAAARSRGGSFFNAELQKAMAAIPSTKSGLRNGLILDGYVYGGAEADVWQDAALAVLDLGYAFDDPGVFEEGAKMVRATLTDFATTLLVGNDLWYPHVQIDGRAANGDFGRSFAPVYKGFAMEEGHTLATLAISRQQYGSAYYSNKWAVGIDGILVINGQAYSGLSINPTSYDSLFPATIGRLGDGKPKMMGQPPLLTAIREIVAEYRDNQTVVVAKTNPIQLSGPIEPQGFFTFADGTKMPANPGPDGFETPVIASDLNGPISFEGSLGGIILKAKGGRATMKPTFDSASAWTALGSMNGVVSGATVSTNGQKAWGELRSQIFTSPHKTLSFTWSGKGDAAIELWDVDGAEVVRRTSTPVAQDSKMTWNLSGLSTRRLQIRVIDNNPDAWISVHGFSLR
jgi:hypothetical protein